MVLDELVDSVLRSCHRESRRFVPDVAVLNARLRSADRESVLGWLVQACDVMRFHDSVFFSTVLLLDRYCALQGEPMQMERMRKVLMAVICTVLKACAVKDDPCFSTPMRDLLLHLCRQQVPFKEILAMEYQVLRALNYDVSAPSPLDFLEALAVPLAAGPAEQAMDRCPLRRLAGFLLQLSLFDARLSYRYPHLVLAAAALYLALCALRAAPRLFRALLEDVGLAAEGAAGAPPARLVAECAAEVHARWAEFAASRGERAASLMGKFADRSIPAAVLLAPPPLACLLEAALAAEASAPTCPGGPGAAPLQQAAPERSPERPSGVGTSDRAAEAASLSEVAQQRLERASCERLRTRPVEVKSTQQV